MIDRNFTYALVGATSNQEKYGYKVLKNLLDSGFRVIPINPKEGDVLGQKVFKSLSDFKNNIDVVIFVVPPVVTEKVLESVFSLGIKNVWMQPGSESDLAIDFCKKNNINFIQKACIMLNK